MLRIRRITIVYLVRIVVIIDPSYHLTIIVMMVAISNLISTMGT